MLRIRLKTLDYQKGTAAAEDRFLSCFAKF
jgi:hypothetical protein